MEGQCVFAEGAAQHALDPILHYLAIGFLTVWPGHLTALLFQTDAACKMPPRPVGIMSALEDNPSFSKQACLCDSCEEQLLNICLCTGVNNYELHMHIHLLEAKPT